MYPVIIRPAQPQDMAPILVINEQGRPGVAPLSPAELVGVPTTAPYICVVEMAGQVAGYVIAYTPDSSYAAPSSRSSACARTKSGVSKPSVNRPYMLASR